MANIIVETDMLITSTPAENKYEILTRDELGDDFEKELAELVKKYLKKKKAK